MTRSFQYLDFYVCMRNELRLGAQIGVNMSKIAVFFAEGFEEIEGLTVVDLCRRAGIETEMVSIGDSKIVKGSHDISILTDLLFEEVDFETLDMLVLPGGMPGTRKLEAHEGLMEQLDAFYGSGKYVASICAAPSIFGHRGMLKGRRACSYPTLESHLEGAEVTKDETVVSDHVITSRGMGTAIAFGLKIVEQLCGGEKAEELKEAIIYKRREV